MSEITLNVKIVVGSSNPKETKEELNAFTEKLVTTIINKYANAKISSEVLEVPEPIKISLSGPDGNAFNIISEVKNALLISGNTRSINGYLAEATFADYQHLKEISELYAILAGTKIIWSE